MSEVNWGPLLKLGGGLTLGLAAVWWLTSESKAASRRLSKDELKKLLKEMSREFYGVFTELAQLSKNVHKSLKEKGLEKNLSPDQVEGLLMQQGVQMKLKEVEDGVLAKHKTSNKDLEAASKAYESDPEVAMYVTGMKRMYDEAVVGTLPVLPGLEIPKELTQELVLRILSEMNEEKVRRFRELFENEATKAAAGAGPTGQKHLFAHKLQITNDQAETAIIAKFDILNNDSVLFQSAIAVYQGDEDFKNKKAELEKKYQDDVVETMKPKASGTSPSSKKEGAIIKEIDLDSLERTSGEELELRVASARDLSTPIVCLITDETVSAQSEALSTYADNVKADKPDCKDCTYLYILLSEAANCPIAQVSALAKAEPERCPVFAIFPGKDDAVIFTKEWDEVKRTLLASAVPTAAEAN